MKSTRANSSSSTRAQIQAAVGKKTGTTTLATSKRSEANLFKPVISAANIANLATSTPTKPAKQPTSLLMTTTTSLENPAMAGSEVKRKVSEEKAMTKAVGAPATITVSKRARTKGEGENEEGELPKKKKTTKAASTDIAKKTTTPAATSTKQPAAADVGVARKTEEEEAFLQKELISLLSLEVETLRSQIEEQEAKYRSLHQQHHQALQQQKALLDQKQMEQMKMLQGVREESQQLRQLVLSTVGSSAGGSSLISLLLSDKNAKQALLETARSFLRPERERIQALERELLMERSLRIQLHNNLQELRGNIKVHCRIRGGRSSPTSSNAEPLLQLIFPSSSAISLTSQVKVNHRNKPSFEFDKIYPSEVTQESVFEDVKPLLTSYLDGFNVTIMTYGQTGSGKTFTMEGTKDLPGIVPRSIRQLFSMASAASLQEFILHFGILEIHNETIKDLLNPNPKAKYELRTKSRSSANGAGAEQTEVEVQNLSRRSFVLRRQSERVDSSELKRLEEEALSVIAKSLTRRSQASTLANSASSRSHCVVMVQQEAKVIAPGASSAGDSINSTLYLVDLAGSECVGQSGVVGEGLREAKNINKSLSALGDVLGALSDQRSHVPYRNSVLTHLLSPSLGGGAKMLLVVTVSPEQENVSETLHALGFGSRARQVVRPVAVKQTSSSSSAAASTSKK